MKLKLLIILGCIITLAVAVLIVELLIIKYNGTPVPAPVTPRGAETYGSGTPLQYVVMGDSTSVGQGGDYDQGFARATARHLGRSHLVTFHNVGVSGARSADVAQKQLSAAVALKPDVVLIAIGANDVTHFTSTSVVRRSLQQTIDGLKRSNPDVKIVFTGSPQMGSVPRFPQPLRYIAKVRTARINTVIAQFSQQKNITFAQLAVRTGPTFAQHPELFAQDKFHPATAGYTIWIPVLEQAIDIATKP
jgi:acyl-CoA thioesterase-1